MASGLYAATSFSIFSSPFSNSNFPSKRFQIYTPPLISHLSFLCRSHNIHSSSTSSSSSSSSSNLHFVLHDSLDDSGIDTTHARAARDGFCSQIQRLSRIERETSITINRGVDLGKVALHIAAEDDALVSHSSVPLPVDSFIERLDDLSMGFCSLYIPPVGSSPELFLGNLERYFYVHKILKNLKDAFWPFKYDHTGSLFLRAAYAANCIGQGTAKGGSFKSSNTLSGLEFASAKAAQHRLGRGVWTSVHFGDMRRALATCERLILLGCDSEELRDYSVLLYHCGFYEESFQYLKLYQDSTQCATRKEFSSNPSAELEEDAVEKLMTRLNLILMEEGWNKSSLGRNFWDYFIEKATWKKRRREMSSEISSFDIGFWVVNCWICS